MSIPTTLYRRLFVYLRPHVPTLLFGTALAIVVATMEGAIAWLVKPAMDDVFIRRDVTMLKIIPLLFLGAYICKGVGRYGHSYLMAAVGERVIAPAMTWWPPYQRAPMMPKAVSTSMSGSVS